jgi:hypothetical protein
MSHILTTKEVNFLLDEENEIKIITEHLKSLNPEKIKLLKNILIEEYFDIQIVPFYLFETCLLSNSYSKNEMSLKNFLDYADLKNIKNTMLILNVNNYSKEDLTKYLSNLFPVFNNTIFKSSIFLSFYFI